MLLKLKNTKLNLIFFVQNNTESAMFPQQYLNLIISSTTPK